MFKILGKTRDRSSTNILAICIQKRYRGQSNVGESNQVHGLRFYDNHIGKQMGRDWASVRLGLLSPSKHCAVLNNFCGDLDKSILKFAEKGGYDMVSNHKEISDCTGKYSILMRQEPTKDESEEGVRDSFDSSMFPPSEPSLTSNQSDLSYFLPAERVLSDIEMDIRSENELYRFKTPAKPEDSIEEPLNSKYPSLSFPYMLKAIVYSKGDVTRFKPSTRVAATGKFNYYLMDAGSILPVLALDLEPDCNVLDLCAAPGGKTYAMLQTMLPSSITCLDESRVRIERLKNVLRDYFPLSYIEDGKVKVDHMNSEDYGEKHPNEFDRVLVDVPCFADRHAINDPENGIFRPSRQADRMIIQQKQQALLLSAIRACKPGGIIVYSTCTLLPPQNDGIVNSVIDQVYSTTKMEVCIVDTGYLVESYEDSFVFNQDPHFSKIGQLVLPNITANFGPTYFCKLRKLK